MKITQSTVALQSQHASASLHTQQTSLRAWVGSQRPDFEGQRRDASGVAGVSLSLSRAAVAQMRMSVASARQGAPVKSDAISEANEAVRNDPRLRLLIDMVEAITGRKMRVFDASQLRTADQPVSSPSPSDISGDSAAGASSAVAPPAGWGLEFDSATRTVESETTRVSAQGVVHTSDGQQINFSLQLEMSRSFVQETSLTIREGDAVRKDPLVINFNGSGAQLTDAQFAFDLDADGQQENIAFVTGGSGFLVLDKNGDGVINNGSELFGTRSGDGFADLAQYDQDGNQWIDENDAVYSQLKIWQRDANGQDRLGTLAQAGVGALYLGRVASPFSVKTDTQQTLGLVRSSGVFLYESGGVGTLQQVDL
jgi:hypothetical protein